MTSDRPPADSSSAASESAASSGPASDSAASSGVASESAASSGAASYDALLLVSFGGPEGRDDVLPFLRNVTRGRGVPDERLVEVGRHYELFGGRSPINDQNRQLLAALRAELAPLPVYWGNRNWRPYLAEALAEMRADGVRRAACFMTSAFASYSGCRQYREDLAEAVAELSSGDLAGRGGAGRGGAGRGGAGGDGAERDGARRDPAAAGPRLDKLRHYFDHPGFVEPMVDNVVAALADLPDGPAGASATLLFTAHSIPLWQAAGSGPTGGAYPRQLSAAAGAIAERVAARTGWRGGWEVVYSSRSGPPSVPWLEPDVGDRIEAVAQLPATAPDGARPGAVVVVPVGFVSDHMEVVYDLDVEAAERAAAVGLPMRRARTVGADPRFVRMVGELLAERVDPTVPRRALTAEGPSHDVCPLTCCPGRTRRPAAAGTPADLAPGRTADTATTAAAGSGWTGGAAGTNARV